MWQVIALSKSLEEAAINYSYWIALKKNIFPKLEVGLRILLAYSSPFHASRMFFKVFGQFLG